MTNFWESIWTLGIQGAGELEQKQAISLASAASKIPTLEHYIWSTLPHASKISNGKFKVPHLDYKAEVDEYIQKSLPELAEKTTYLWAGWYSSNMVRMKPFEIVSPITISPC
jgi:hypothetical protein